MKPGTEMDHKQGQTTLVVAERDQESIHRSSIEAPARRQVIKIVLGLVALAMFSGVTLTAVYLGGYLTKEAVKESYFTFRMPDGTTIKKKITVTGTEEDITVLDQDTRIIYDYSKGFSVKKIKENGLAKCYVSTFDRSRVSPPAIDEAPAMMNINVTSLPESAYYVQKDEMVDAAILSPRSRDMCQGLPIYWMTKSSNANGKRAMMHRQKRCSVRCGVGCTCCPVECVPFCWCS